MSVVSRLALCAVLFPMGALAQPAGSSIASGGGTGSDVGERIAVDPYSGRTAVVGTFQQTATFGSVSVTSADAPAARSDAFVVVYDPDGTALWARRMGTDVFNDFGAGVAFRPAYFSTDGAIYVSGFFTGVATFDGGANPTVTRTTRSDFDAFLAAYSADGDLLWVEQAGGVDQDTGRDVVVDFDGSVYWAGGFTGTATWGQGAAAQTRTSAGSSDGFLARYAPDGTLTWLLTAGGTDSDDLRGVALYPYGGGLVATGTFRGVATFGTLPLQSRGLSDVAVVSVAPFDGAVQWAQQVGGNGSDYARGIAASFTGNVAVAGSFENTILVGTDVLTSAGFSDAFLAVFDAQGTPLAGRRGGGAGFDIANAVSVSPFIDTPTLGGGAFAPFFAVAGYVNGASTFGTTSVSAQGNDAFLAVYRDSVDAPRLLDAVAIGASNSDRGYGVAVGGYVVDVGFPFPIQVTGSFRDTVPFGGSTVTSVGSGDVFVTRSPGCPAYGCPLGVNASPTADAALLNLAVAPNPAREGAVVTVTLAEPAEATLEVVDARGRTVAVVHQGTLAAGITRLALPALAPGPYWVRVTTPGASAVRPLAVVR